MSMVLPADISSPDQLGEVLLELQDVVTAVRSAQARTTQGAIEPPVLSGDLAQLIQRTNVNVGDIAALEALAQDIRRTLDTAPTAHILLSATPTRSMKRTLTTWFRTEIDPQILLSFAARSDLGGGAVIQVGSHLYDFSFRRTILDHKSRLTELAGV